MFAIGIWFPFRKEFLTILFPCKLCVTEKRKYVNKLKIPIFLRNSYVFNTPLKKLPWTNLFYINLGRITRSLTRWPMTGSFSRRMRNILILWIWWKDILVGGYFLEKKRRKKRCKMGSNIFWQWKELSIHGKSFISPILFLSFNDYLSYV